MPEVQVVHGDILQVDWLSLHAQPVSKIRWWDLPYQISSYFGAIVRCSAHLVDACLLQREVVDAGC